MRADYTIDEYPGETFRLYPIEVRRSSIHVHLDKSGFPTAFLGNLDLVLCRYKPMLYFRPVEPHAQDEREFETLLEALVYMRGRHVPEMVETTKEEKT